MSNNPRIIQLSRFLDRRGNLSVIEEMKDIPFEIKRAYWVYDVPGGESRKGHAYHKSHELIVALSGSFDVVTDQGSDPQTFSLNRSYYGLYVPCGVWRQLTNFSTNSLALILTSTPYTPKDYIYSRKEYLEIVSK
ncbi:MAG: WxcM-like domain-containing protein [Bacteroides sp.]|nr:WxcM-like domain-containing protein [Bacteroides sp.]